jgi:hypothetical protein
MVLRLSMPFADAFQSVAADLAVKIAESLGRAAGDAAAAAESVRTLAADVAPAGSGGAAGDEITFEFHRIDDELRIEARCAGRSSEARHPLPT